MARSPPPPVGKSVLLDICEISPWEKWTRYRVLPVKFLLHALLVIFTTWSVIEDSVRWVPYRFSSQQNFCYFFAPDKCVDSLCGSIDLAYGIDNPSGCYTYAINETIGAVQKIVTNYYGIHNMSVANYYLRVQPDGSVKRVVMTVQAREHVQDLVSRRTARYVLTPDDMGPIDPRHQPFSSINTFFQLLTSLVVEFELDDTFASDTHELCYMWAVRIKFNVVNKAELAVTQQARVLGFCTDRLTGREIAVEPVRFWLNITIMTLGGCLSLLILKEWFESYQLLVYARQVVADLQAPTRPATPDLAGDGGRVSNSPHHPRAPPWRAGAAAGGETGGLLPSLDWREVSTGVKARFFNLWLLETLLACVLSTTEAVHSLCVYRGPMTSSMHTLMAGLGSALFWINLVNYLHHSDRLYAIVLVIRRSIPRVGKLLVQIVPIFVGYALLGVMTFGYYYASFGSFQYASASLFSIWNGDMLLSTIQDLHVFFGLFGFVYVLAFVFLFIYVILNIVLCIVLQTLVYVHTVEAKRRKMVHGLLRHRRSSEVGRSSRPELGLQGLGRRPGSSSSLGGMLSHDLVALTPLGSETTRIFLELLDLAKEHEDDPFDSSALPRMSPGGREAGGGGTPRIGPRRRSLSWAASGDSSTGRATRR